MMPLVVTPTETAVASLWLSVKVIVAVPPSTAVTVKLPVPDAGETVATDVLLDTAANEPPYPGSLTAIAAVCPAAVNCTAFGEATGDGSGVGVAKFVTVTGSVDEFPF
jgi:hypothetical protein